MPRYLFETEPLGEDRVATAMELASVRFPELVVEHRYAARAGTRAEVWVCTAPSLAHVQRWCDTAQFGIAKVHHVDEVSR